MTRVAGKSRGCATCKRRRIKCDENIPECGQCRRKKIRCPGAVTGTFYVISTTDKVSSNGLIRSTRTRKQDMSKQNSLTENEVSEQTSDYMPMIYNDLQDFELPSCYQPSRGELFDQLMFSHFFDTYGWPVESIRTCSWLSHLPQLMATTFRSKAMKYSSRATCMAFYGILNGNVSIQHQARRVYAVALNSQRSEMYEGRKVTTPSQEAICTSIMMAYFEMVTSTTSLAWEQHMNAAASMLEMRGPTESRDRFTHQLFRTVRLGVVYASIVKKRKHVFAEREWLKATPDDLRTPLDFLIDILFALSHYMEALDTFHHLPAGREKDLAQKDLKMGLAFLLFDLDSHSPLLDYDLSMKACHLHDDDYDPLPGCLFAMQSAAYLILFHIMCAVCERTEGERYQSLMQEHSTKILSAVESINSCTRSHASRIFVAAVLPLEVAAIWSPLETDRAQAREHLLAY